MIFTGNAAELAELTRKWWALSGWWPRPLAYSQSSGRWYYDEHASNHISPHVAASIIFAAAMVWLAEKGPTVLARGKEGVNYQAWHMYSSTAHFAPSPLHAVLAAVEACK